MEEKYFGPRDLGYDERDKILLAQGFPYPLRNVFRFWAQRIVTVSGSVLPEHLLVVRTRDLSQQKTVNVITDFAEQPRTAPVHAHKQPTIHYPLDVLDEEYVHSLVCLFTESARRRLEWKGIEL